MAFSMFSDPIAYTFPLLIVWLTLNYDVDALGLTLPSIKVMAILTAAMSLIQLRTIQVTAFYTFFGLVLSTALAIFQYSTKVALLTLAFLGAVFLLAVSS